MEILTTANSHENSVTIVRESSKVDFCCMGNEVIIGETIGDTGDNHHQIVLNLEEAQILKGQLISHLG